MNIFGILGGTFDPIHNGHLELATKANKVFNFAKVFFVPNYVPPHRTQPRESAQHRLTMAQLAIEPYENFLIDSREIQRKGDSYMAETLESFRYELIGRDSPMALILGVDSFVNLLEWHEPHRVAAAAHIIVLPREGFEYDKVELKTRQILDALYKPGKELMTRPEMLATKPAGEVIFLSERPMAVSATEVRASLKAGKCVDGLLPKSVYQYIQENGLYL